MRALSIQQPWAWAIFRAGKDVENRADRRGQDHARWTWTRAAGQDVLVHTSKRYAGADAHRFVADLSPVPMSEPGGPGRDVAWEFGSIIGVVRVEGVHTAASCEATGSPCSPWAETGCAHLQLADPRLLSRAVPAYGRLGLWVPDDDVLAQVRRRLP